MNEQLVNASKTPLVRNAAGALIATLGGVLAISGLIAQTPSPSPTAKGQCKYWPCTASQPIGECDALRNKVKKVFTDLMDQASKKGDLASETLRKEITESANGYNKARLEVRKRLKDIVTFPDDHQVIFYEPENSMGNKPSDPCPMSEYPNNQCLHVFYLPEMTEQPKSEFKKQLMCCYQPW